ncbi:hypothetical protein GZH52_07580 [Crenobacter sp. HX-7-9]|uniref:LRAT domain-containing protein n=1 Tax=Crenobacter caeni TaxID=2705474 RepID=A0A6B2KR98_9NEIS|nr:hypothetical protein [Crenobacter caeni]
MNGQIKRPVNNLVESFIDNAVRDKVSAPAIGSVIYCDLAAGTAEHSGIYIGSNNIVHLSGDGIIERVNPKQFINRLGGWNTAISIYVSCNAGTPVGSTNVAKLAESMIGSQRSYNLIMDNCHQFTAGCLSGNFENSCNFFTFLKDEVQIRIGGTEWRVWDL